MPMIDVTLQHGQTLEEARRRLEIAVNEVNAAVFLDEAEDPKDAAHAEFAVAAVDRGAERADVGADPVRAGEQGRRGRRRSRRPILRMDRVAPARALVTMLAEELSGGRIQEADARGVPLDRDRAAEPAGRRAVVGVLDLDTAVEVDRARAEVVVAKRLDRQRQERRPLLREHRGDLALGGAVDPGVGPARVPAIEIGLGRLERLEAQPLEGGLGVPDGRLHLALLEGRQLQLIR